MLSSTMLMNTPKTPFLSTPFLPHRHSLLIPQKPLLLPPHLLLPKPASISSLILPPSSSPRRKTSQVQGLILPPSSSSSAKQQPQQQQQHLYQPYRPPPLPLPPQFRSLDTAGRLEILTNRLGLWFEYAPLIPTLYQEGLTISVLEEITGISGVEQDRIVVAAQVRDSLVESEIDADILSVFDTRGAELLYEIRRLNASQRAAAARYLVLNGFDAKMAQELSRAMKDKPRRRDNDWESFDDDLPGDCLAYMYFRLAHEHKSAASSQKLRRSALEKALEALESEKARKRVLEELEGKKDVAEGGGGGEVGVEEAVTVPVVRMKIGEVAEATAVAVLPVCRAEEGGAVEVEEAPWEIGGTGDFGVVEAEKGWRRWVVLPGWKPVAVLKGGGVAVAFDNARALPWTATKWNRNEPILVVADRGRKEVVADDGFYLVIGGGNGSAKEGLKVERGSELKENGVKDSLGSVVVVVRPPREEYDDQISNEDWE